MNRFRVWPAITSSGTAVLVVFGAYASAQTPADPVPRAACTIAIHIVRDADKDTTTGCRYCFTPESALLDTAFIKDHEIIGYRVQDGQHFLMVGDEHLERIKDMTRSIGTFPVRQAFALVVDGRPLYVGWFLSAHVSSFHMCEWVHIHTPIDREGKGRIWILFNDRLARSHGLPDPRGDTRLMECLRATGRL